MKKTKQKLLIVVMVIVALAIVAVVTLTGHSDPYKTKEYKHLEVNEIFKGDHYVYFYSPKDSKSVSSDTGIRSLNKGINDLYFVNLNEKNDDLKEIDLTKYGNLKEIKPTTLIYVRDGKIEKAYKGVNQISNAQEKILEGSWDN
ncbi:hypothetical protein DWY83_07800 [Coprobacillus sp. AF27-24BH]|nr:hypothetical protein DWY83_07800 [Coprobacillus sp. AF27-24BH]